MIKFLSACLVLGVSVSALAADLPQRSIEVLLSEKAEYYPGTGDTCALIGQDMEDAEKNLFLIYSTEDECDFVANFPKTTKILVKAGAYKQAREGSATEEVLLDVVRNRWGFTKAADFHRLLELEGIEAQ